LILIKSFFHLIFLNKTLIHFNIFKPFLKIKKHTNFLFAIWLLFLKPFQKTIKKHQTNHSAFYPEVRDFDPSQVRRQKTFVFPNQKNSKKKFPFLSIITLIHFFKKQVSYSQKINKNKRFP